MIPKVIIRRKNEDYMILNKDLVHEIAGDIYTKEKRLEEYPEFYCGDCGRIMSTRSLNYCPHCGAKNKAGDYIPQIKLTEHINKDINKETESYPDTFF